MAHRPFHLMVYRGKIALEEQSNDFMLLWNLNEPVQVCLDGCGGHEVGEAESGPFVLPVVGRPAWLAGATVRPAGAGGRAGRVAGAGVFGGHGWSRF